MRLSPELKLLVSAQATASDDYEDVDDADIYEPSIREQLSRLGLQKATKQERRDIIVKAMERDPDA